LTNCALSAVSAQCRLITSASANRSGIDRHAKSGYGGASLTRAARDDAHAEAWASAATRRVRPNPRAHGQPAQLDRRREPETEVRGAPNGRRRPRARGRRRGGRLEQHERVLRHAARAVLRRSTPECRARVRPPRRPRCSQS
jgi:hypothetical protein